MKIVIANKSRIVCNRDTLIRRILESYDVKQVIVHKPVISYNDITLELEKLVRPYFGNLVWSFENEYFNSFCSKIGI